MKNKVICLVILCLCTFTLSAKATVSQDWIEFYVFKTDAGYGAEIWLGVDGVSGAGLVQATVGASPVLVFDFNSDDDDYELETDYATLGELNTQISGTWAIEVMYGGKKSVYNFNIAEITESMFAPVPTITSHSDGDTIGTHVNFEWEWTPGGGFDYTNTGFYVEAYVEDPGVDYWEIDAMSTNFGGVMANTVESWEIDLGITGDAEFLVAYGTEATVVGGITFNAGLSDVGATDFGFDEVEQVIASEDFVELTVAPEPMSISLMGLGALAMLRRRRK